jgi:hypothetical protein
MLEVNVFMDGWSEDKRSWRHVKIPKDQIFKPLFSKLLKTLT